MITPERPVDNPRGGPASWRHEPDHAAHPVHLPGVHAPDPLPRIEVPLPRDPHPLGAYPVAPSPPLRSGPLGLSTYPGTPEVPLLPVARVWGPQHRGGPRGRGSRRGRLPRRGQRAGAVPRAPRAQDSDRCCCSASTITEAAQGQGRRHTTGSSTTERRDVARLTDSTKRSSKVHATTIVFVLRDRRRSAKTQMMLAVKIGRGVPQNVGSPTEGRARHFRPKIWHSSPLAPEVPG